MTRPRNPAHGVKLKSLYTAANLDGIEHLASRPGEVPFVRGPYPTMYTQKPWTIRQYAGFADAMDSNLALRTALAEGAQGLSIAFDLPTHRGYDSDDPRAYADVGMAGVAIDSVEDMKRLFAQIPLDEVSVSMTMSGAVLPVLSAFIVAAEESGVAPAQLAGTIQNDILKEYMVRNTWIFAPVPSMRIAADVVDYLTTRVPKFNAMSISGYHFQEAGADAVLELALTFANARAYIDELRGRDMDIDALCSRLSFFFGVGTDFYVEIAKLRAARLIWSDLTAKSGARTAKARALRMHCQTSGWSLAAQQPQNNVVRTTIEAMAAVFGGTQSLHTNAYDEALALPSADASRLARDTQLIMQHEMGLRDVIDPWAGSYMMETLTADIARRVSEAMDAIDAQGGVLEAISSGWVHRQIHESATRTQAHIDDGQQVVVGVNRFQSSENDGAFSGCLEIDGALVRAQQVARLSHLRKDRDSDTVARRLSMLTDAAQSGEGNLLALTIECVRARATLGECTRALERVWPRYTMSQRFSAGIYGEERAHRRSEPAGQAWRSACGRVGRLSERIGRRPRVLVAKMGQDGHDRGAKLVAAALDDAGFEVVLAELFQSPGEVAAQALNMSADAVGISSLSGAHLELIPQLVDALRLRGSSIPVAAGGTVPAAHVMQLKRQGVHQVFGPGALMETIVECFVDMVDVLLPPGEQFDDDNVACGNANRVV
jgi:methylmalonyl-CoA mutase